MLRGMFKYECNQLHNFLQIYTTTKCLYLSGKDLIDTLKLAPNIKKHTIYSASYRHLHEGQSGLYCTIIDFNEVDIRIYLPEKVIFIEAARPR